MKKRLPFRTRFFLLFVCIAAPTGAAWAQNTFRVGPEISFVRSTGAYRSEPYNPFTFGSGSGFEAGVRLDVRLGHWALQPRVLYAQRGFALNLEDQTPNPYGAGVETTSDRLTYRLQYLTVPVSFAYAQKADGQGVQGFAGGYVGRLLGGHMDYDYTYTRPGFSQHGTGQRAVRPSKEFTSDQTQYFLPWDAGVQAGLGYRCGETLVQAGYSLGVVNAGASNGVGIKYHNDYFFATISYLFGAKPSAGHGSAQSSTNW